MQQIGNTVAPSTYQQSMVLGLKILFADCFELVYLINIDVPKPNQASSQHV